MVLGFDIDGDEAGRQLKRLAAARAELPAGDPRLLAGETRILRIFADISALWRNRRVPSESGRSRRRGRRGRRGRPQPAGVPARLPALQGRRRGRPARVVPDQAAPDPRPLRHHRTGALARARSRRCTGSSWLTAVRPLTCRSWPNCCAERLRDPESLPEDARDDYRRVVDQLVSATQLRHPAVGDLARQVRYRCFDAPAIAAERARAQQQVRAELDHLSAEPGERGARPASTPSPGRPRTRRSSARRSGICTTHAVMLEVMTRRYYRIRPLQNVQVDRAQRSLAGDRRVHPRRAGLLGHRDRGRRPGQRGGGI